MSDFLLRALLAGLSIALAAGPLGSFVVWRRMAYFGDTLAHSALMGVAIGVFFSVNPYATVIGVAVLLACILILLEQKNFIATDTILGILSHSSLAIGLVIIGVMDNIRIDLTGYLFGDLLAVSTTDLAWIACISMLTLIITTRIWRPLIALTVHEELAQVEGIAVKKLKVVLTVMIALLIAVAIKIVGVLLITALLVIPAATAHRISHSPVQMATLASIAGCLAVVAGLGMSYYMDTPAGPSIVVAATLLFAINFTLASKTNM